MTRTEQELRSRLHVVKGSRDKDRQRHDRHFAELSEVKGQLHLAREHCGRLTTALANVIKSLEDGTPPSDVVRGARTILGLKCGGAL